MIFGFQRKLLAALLVASLVQVAVMASLMYWSFHRGFTNYLRQTETEELKPISEALIHAYKYKGSWKFLDHDPLIWGMFMRFLPGGEFEDHPPESIIDMLVNPMPSPIKNEPFSPSSIKRYRDPNHKQATRKGPAPPLGKNVNFPVPATDSGSLNWRLSLLDRHKQIIFGKENTTISPLVIPLKIGEEVIGWLSVKRISWLEKGLTEKFLSSQLLAVIISASIALALSLLIALPMGKSILKPVSLVIEGVRKIARGNLIHRIQWHNKDEFNELIKDVNNLSSTLQENEGFRRTMMANISHELRTPLAVLQVEIEAIQDGIRPCDNDRLESLHHSVRSLSRLIDDLFDLSLSDSGNLSYQKREMDIIVLLKRCFELYSNLFAKENIVLEKDLVSKGIIYGDNDRLNQVFSNLLNNAYRYTDNPGKVRMTATVDGATITVTIMDTKPGVPDEHLQEIFDRFFRVDKSRSRAHGGSGLGLSLCRTIIKDHGGTITASHSVLGGLAILITLPIYNAKKSGRSR